MRADPNTLDLLKETFKLLNDMVHEETDVMNKIKLTYAMLCVDDTIDEIIKTLTMLSSEEKRG